MFEKKAKESFEKRYPNNIAINSHYVEGFNDGYSKANEWYYPSKGEYPKEYKDILICFLTEDDMKDFVRGWYEYGLDEDKHYFKTVNTFGTAVIKNVYAWKEIVPPKDLLLGD